jgi:hypothetical protein
VPFPIAHYLSTPLSCLPQPANTLSTRYSPLTTHYLLSFHTLTNSFATPKTLTPAFSSSSTLFPQNTRGGLCRRPFSRSTPVACHPGHREGPAFPSLATRHSSLPRPHPSPFFTRISFQRSYSSGSAKNIIPKHLQRLRRVLPDSVLGGSQSEMREGLGGAGSARGFGEEAGNKWV